MALFTKGSELDDWAKALGVSNDGDAAGVLRVLLVKVIGAQLQTREVARALRDAPESSASAAAASADRELTAAGTVLALVLHRFNQHERGRG